MSKFKKIYLTFIAFLDKHALVILLSIAFIASIAADIYSYNNNLIIAYGDARAHLTIARRVFDSLTPGVTQLGSVWLPVLHALILPFTVNNFLYYSGLAGTIVNTLFYLFSSIYLFKIISKFTKSRIIALFCSLIFVLNINILYMQSTAMTEMLAIFFITSTIYYFLNWQESSKLSDLLLLSVMIFFGSLTRYEIWAMVPAVFVGIIINFIGTNKSLKKHKELESHLIIFCYCAFCGILIWLLWNYLLFNDALYFLNSAYSAGAYQVNLIKQGLDKPFHNPVFAFDYYLYSVADVNSWSLIGLTIVGIMYSFFKKKYISILALLIVSFSIFAFESYSLFKGNTVVWVPELYPFNIYNIRYGLYSLIPLIIFTSLLFTFKNIFTRLILIAIILTQIFYSIYLSNPVTLLETVYVARQGNGYYGKQLPDYINFFKKNYDNGLILSSSSIVTDVQFLSHIDMKYFITEGNQKFWKESIKSPNKYARWIIFQEGTDIRNFYLRPLFNSPALNKNFNLIYNKNSILIYKKK